MTARVVVVGSANIDRTIALDAMPAAGETVLGGPAARGPGGKGLNQAVAAARMGLATSFVGAIGSDPDGDLLVGVLEADGVDVTGVVRVEVPTGLAVILLESDGSNRIVVSPGANSLADASRHAIGADDVVVVQLEIPMSTVAAVLAAASEAGATTILNAAPARTDLGELLPLVDVLVVNEPELGAIVGPTGNGGVTDIALASLPVRRGVVVTRGAAGASVVEVRSNASGAIAEIPAPAVDVVDTTGAGDCLVGVLGAALAVGSGLHQAVAVAVEAASQAVTRAGAAASMPTAADLSDDSRTRLAGAGGGRGRSMDEDGPPTAGGTGH